MHFSILQYSVLIKFVSITNTEIHRFLPIERLHTSVVSNDTHVSRCCALFTILKYSVQYRNNNHNVFAAIIAVHYFQYLPSPRLQTVGMQRKQLELPFGASIMSRVGSKDNRSQQFLFSTLNGTKYKISFVSFGFLQVNAPSVIFHSPTCGIFATR